MIILIYIFTNLQIIDFFYILKNKSDRIYQILFFIKIYKYVNNIFER